MLWFYIECNFFIAIKCLIVNCVLIKDMNI
jgi:hypothetical protein